MTKIKEFFGAIKDWFVNWKASLEDMYLQMFDKHPFILGCIEGQIAIYWFVVIGAWLSSLIHRRPRVWKLTDK